MVIPEEREGRMEDDPDLARGADSANETVSTRKAGGVAKPKETPKVIAAMASFIEDLYSVLQYILKNCFWFLFDVVFDAIVSQVKTESIERRFTLHLQ